MKAHFYEQIKNNPKAKFILCTDKSLVMEYYDAQGRFHNPDGPAWVKWNADGKLMRQTHYRHGICHNLSGPAHLELDHTGAVVAFYYIDGYIQGPYNAILM